MDRLSNELDRLVNYLSEHAYGLGKMKNEYQGYCSFSLPSLIFSRDSDLTTSVVRPLVS